MTTAIEWTDRTWNPVTGCDRTSPGCDNCYALTMARRLKAMGQPRYQNDGDPHTSGPGFGVTCHSDVLDIPRRWRKPSMVFVNSMSDLFHPDVPYRFIREVFNAMRCCNGQTEASGRTAPSHTFQVLTKRSQRMRDCSLNRELGYDPARPVLQGMAVDIPPGSFVGIVGSSGSGKSTLLKLLTRLYDPNEGVIRVDGHDIAKVDLYSLRAQIGVVPQDSLLFDGSVMANLALARPDAGFEEICQAAQVACAHEFIQALPAGWGSPDFVDTDQGFTGESVRAVMNACS